uniref:NopRA1 domain-containing protein n=1 Tax=Onchocerca flexuosa TaxID=387005 RepID=A0A183HAL9_9BILA
LFFSYSQAEEDENEWTNSQLLEEVLDRLGNKKYDEVYDLIIAADYNEILAIYRRLFRVIIEEYDNDFSENGISDPILENLLLLMKSYGASNDRLMVSLQCSDQVISWKAFIMLGNFIEEILPELKDLNESFSFSIRKVYIPSWMERFEKNAVLNYPDDQSNKEYLSNLETDYLDDNYYNVELPDTSSDLFLSAVFMFLRIFTLSMSRNYGILDVLCDRILACTHIESHFLEAFMLKLDAIYRFSDRALPLNTLVFVNSFKARFCSLPRVYSPEYYLKLAIKPLRHSLHVSTSNMFNVGYVVLVLRKCLVPIKNESIERNQWTFFLGFLADFIICCEECTLCKVREACMDTFKMFLSKFEPIAQVLIIRKLFNMIRKNEIR